MYESTRVQYKMYCKLNISAMYGSVEYKISLTIACMQIEIMYFCNYQSLTDRMTFNVKKLVY